MNSIRWQPFREAKFRQDCSSIELTKNGSDEVTYQGPGELWQEDDRTLVFKCCCHDETGSAIGDIFRETAALQPGKLLPRGAFYSFHVVTADGEEWSTEDISLNRGYSTITGQLVVSGNSGRSNRCGMFSLH